jgi:Asp-tRNA(Asn)/Glu-tRNA(Gln) amidotransferase A subunit family amidase
MAEPFELTACDALEGMAKRKLSAEELTRSCLARIEAYEPEIEAWAWLDGEAALATARRLDERGPSGPLHGIPLGVKEVIDTADMPTLYGSAIYDGWRPTDAGCVMLKGDVEADHASTVERTATFGGVAFLWHSRHAGRIRL